MCKTRSFNSNSALSEVDIISIFFKKTQVLHWTMIFYILYIKQKSSLLCMLVIGRLWCLVKNDCTYFSVDFYFISKARKFTQNLHRNWKNKDIHFDVLRWSRNFLPGKLCLRELKGSEAYLVTLLWKSLFLLEGIGRVASFFLIRTWMLLLDKYF